ncbi:class I SAM-dependent methyltransferase [Zavarzinia compransoris]|uniref:class I SAM-dependent methyltransferase n=1 Tax=Zavarzinia marina TaxID=2911065 RepID=UPI001F2ABB56|nr:class I SAM-dependent methyltransferase [Zavarzinia marina]MCF4167670.1 class I SAM-dependent methyltransferase [Zavarzinia marina]
MSTNAYDDIAPFYAAMVPPTTRAGLYPANPDMASRIARLSDGSHILDAACGSAYDAIAISRGLPGLCQPPRRFVVACNDRSAAMVRQARENCRRVLGAELEMRQCAMAALADVPEWRGRFDLVIAPNALTTLSDTQDLGDYPDYLLDCLAGMRAVLKPGGTLLVDMRDWDRAHPQAWTLTRRVYEDDDLHFVVDYRWAFGPTVDSVHEAHMTIWQDAKRDIAMGEEDYRFAGIGSRDLATLFERARFSVVAAEPQVRGLDREPFLTFELRRD